MNVKRVRHHGGVFDLPDFGRADLHRLVDALHVHRSAVDCKSAAAHHAHTHAHLEHETARAYRSSGVYSRQCGEPARHRDRLAPAPGRPDVQYGKTASFIHHLAAHHSAAALAFAVHPIGHRPSRSAHAVRTHHVPTSIPAHASGAHTHNFETVSEQRNRPAIADIDDHLRAFAGSENDVVGLHGRLEQSPIGSDLVEAAVIIKAETVKPRI